MRYKPGLDETIERLRRFWMLADPLDRIPCSITLPAPPRPGMDGAFFDNLGEYLTFQEDIFINQMQVADDRLPVVYPQYGHALIGALCGSPIRHEAGTIWTSPIIEDWDDLDSFFLDFNSEHGEKCRSQYETLLDWANGNCAVARYETEGVTDTMSALRGAQHLLYDMIDSPDQVKHFAHIVTDILIDFCHWNFEHVANRQNLCGGSASNWGLWHPARSIHMAEDSSVLMSPDAFRTFIKPEVQRLTSEFPRTLMEVHHEGNHQIPEFGDIDGIGLLVIENPLHMPPKDQEAILALQESKAFMFGCEPAEIEAALRLMGKRGIYITTNAATPSDAQELLAAIEGWTKA